MTARPRRELWALVILAVVVRLVHLWSASQGPLFRYHLTFEGSDMHMFDQWARQIVEGDLLGHRTPHYLTRWQLDLAPKEKWDEWYGPAPVFYKAPFYAYLVAALYGLCGDAMLPLALLQSACAAACLILLVGIGDRLVGPVASRLGGLLFALYAPAIHFDVVMLRGPWIVLTSLGVTWSLVRLRERPSALAAAAVGATVGSALLVNEGFLTLPFLVALLFAWWFPGRPALRLAGAFVLGLAIVLSPVAARNVAVGAPPLRLAVTGGTVYAVFNASSTSPYFFRIHPRVIAPILEASGGTLSGTILACLRTFSGPLAVLRFYAEKLLGLVVPYENPDNVNFYYARLKDPLLAVLPAYGTLFPLAVLGLVLLRRRLFTLEPLLPAFLATLLSIAITQALSRYRVTLIVYLMPLAGLTVSRMVGWFRERRLRPLALAAFGIAGLAGLSVLIQSRIVFSGRPSNEFLYRPVEFKLGEDFYSGQGRYAEASAEVMSLIARSEGRVRATALLALVPLEMRRGEPGTAREALRAAVRLAASDPLVLLLAGDLYRDTFQDHATAREVYERAEAVEAATAELRQALRDRMRNLKASPEAR